MMNCSVLFKRVAGSGFASWHVVEIKDTLDRKWDMPFTFDKAQVAARVCDLWQLDNLALTDTHSSLLPFPTPLQILSNSLILRLDEISSREYALTDAVGGRQISLTRP